MKKLKNKYSKFLSTTILLIYFFFLSTASFHNHHIRYFSNISFSDNAADVQNNESLNCVFNQINRPTYFYCYTQSFTLEDNIEELALFLPINSLFYRHQNNISVFLRAPPTIS